MKKSQYHLALWILPLIFCAVYFLLRLSQNGPLKLGVLALLQLTPIAICIVKHKMDYVPVVLASHFVGYTLVPLLQIIFKFGDPLAVSDLKPINALLVCTMIFIFMFYLARQFLYRSPHQKETFKKLPVSEKFLYIATALIISSFCFEVFAKNYFGPFLSNCQFLLTVFMFCMSVPAAPALLTTVQIVLALIPFFSFVVTANLGFAINLLAIWMIQGALTRTIRSFVPAFLLLIPMVLFQSIKGDFRAHVAHIPESQLLLRSETLWDCIKRKFGSSQRHSEAWSLYAENTTQPTRSDFMAPVYASAVEKSLGRVHDRSLNEVMELTPHPVPYWEGHSYLFFFYLTVPQWLWWGEPLKNMQNEYGHRYHILAPDDKITEVVFSYFAEGYANFGYWGLYVTAFLLALLFALIEKISDFDLQGYYSFTFIAFLMPILSYQMDFSTIAAKMVWTSLILVPLRTPLLKYINERRLSRRQKRPNAENKGPYK
ncbi:MAG: hypothetical protein HY537_08515 [Deltaproteobacteria bacterium]|nr:hypothetical protein [Deltaproteobacteria bacterium]